MTKTTREQAKGWEERFREMWDRDFAEPCKHNPDQFIVLSPIKYLEFIEHLLEEERERIEKGIRSFIAVNQQNRAYTGKNQPYTRNIELLDKVISTLKPKENNEEVTS